MHSKTSNHLFIILVNDYIWFDNFGFPEKVDVWGVILKIYQYKS